MGAKKKITKEILSKQNFPNGIHIAISEFKREMVEKIENFRNLVYDKNKTLEISIYKQLYNIIEQEFRVTKEELQSKSKVMVFNKNISLSELRMIFCYITITICGIHPNNVAVELKKDRTLWNYNKIKIQDLIDTKDERFNSTLEKVKDLFLK